MDEESFHQEAQLNDPIVDDAGIVKMDLVQGMLDLVIGPRIRALALESEPPSSPPIEIQKKASLTESIEYSNEANILTSIVSHRQVSDTDVSNAVILGPLDAPDVEIEPSELEVEALDEGASDPTDEIQPQDADGNFSVTSGNLYEYDMKPTATLLPLISDVRNGGLMNFVSFNFPKSCM